MIINSNSYNVMSDRMELLWENEDTTAEFPSSADGSYVSSTTIPLNVSSYKMLYILFYASTSVQQLHTQVLMPQAGETRLICDYNRERYTRLVKSNNSSLTFRNGTVDAVNYATAADNLCAIPYRVYGVY